jgi:hypothetical protein
MEKDNIERVEKLWTGRQHVVREPERKGKLERYRRRWNTNMKTDPRVIRWEDTNRFVCFSLCTGERLLLREIKSPSPKTAKISGRGD